jgi:cytidylate kinase
MSVMTVSREMGSQGRYIAERAARNLGYHFVDKNTIQEILSQYGFGDFRQEYDAGQSFWTRFDSRRADMMNMLNRVIQVLARHGDVVILGRGSFAVLGGMADVLNVRVQAPLPLRIKRVMARRQISEPDRAEAIVTESDKVRADFIESFYKVRWETANAFDVVIDTGKVPADLAVNWLVETVEALDEKPADAERTTGDIETDRILDKVVAGVLEYRSERQVV